MWIGRDRRSSLALGLLGLLCIGKLAMGQEASGDRFSVQSVLPPSRLESRPSPFYDQADPATDLRESLTPRGSATRAETSNSEVKPSELTPALDPTAELEFDRLTKTPLPDSQPNDRSPENSTAGGRSGFGSSVVWALGILAVGWLARQWLKANGSLPSMAPSTLEILSRQSLGPQQQLTLVQCGRRILLIGTTQSAISTLATVEDPDEVQAIMAQMRPAISRIRPTLLDLFRSQRAVLAPETIPLSVTISTSSRTVAGDPRAVHTGKQEVADV